MAIREGANTVIYPDRFPFDALDPAPDYCAACSCSLSRPDGKPQSECRYPADCDCHEEWRQDTDELLKREMWGDR